MKNPIHPYAIYTSQEAAEILALDIVTIQRYIRSGKLKATQLGKIYRISGQSLLDIMALDSNSVRMSQDRVKQIENTNYIKSKAFIFDNPKATEFLKLFDKANDALINTWNPDYQNSTKDLLTLKYIGSRLFNTAIAAFHSCLSGYYQISFSLQRDLIETQFLLDVFRSFPEKIKEWREADDKKLKSHFSPLSLRILLDKRDGFEKKKRAERYQKLCKYASHMTYAGFTLLTNDSNQIELGPFYNEKKLLNCLHDLALHYSYPAMLFIGLVKSPNLQSQRIAIEHMKLFHEVFREEIKIPKEAKQKLKELNEMYSQVFFHT